MSHVYINAASPWFAFSPLYRFQIFNTELEIEIT